jgi:hypothetical protein
METALMEDKAMGADDKGFAKPLMRQEACFEEKANIMGMN